MQLGEWDKHRYVYLIIYHFQVLVWVTNTVSFAMEAFIPSTSTRSTKYCPRYSQASQKTMSHKSVGHCSGSMLRPAPGWAWLNHLPRKSLLPVSLDMEEQRLQVRKITSVNVVCSAMTQSSLPQERLRTNICFLTPLFTTTLCSTAAVAPVNVSWKSKWRDPTNIVSTLLQHEMQGLLGLLSAMLLTWCNHFTPMIILSAV